MRLAYLEAKVGLLEALKGMKYSRDVKTEVNGRSLNSRTFYVVTFAGAPSAEHQLRLLLAGQWMSCACRAPLNVSENAGKLQRKSYLESVQSSRTKVLTQLRPQLVDHAAPY